MNKYLQVELSYTNPSVHLEVGSRSSISFGNTGEYYMPFEIQSIMGTNPNSMTIMVLDPENKISETNVGSQIVFGHISTKVIAKGTLVRLLSPS